MGCDGYSSACHFALGKCQSTSRVRSDMLMTLHHTPYWCISLDWVESELVGLSVKVLAWDATRGHRFVVRTAGGLHSMVVAVVVVVSSPHQSPRCGA